MTRQRARPVIENEISETGSHQTVLGSQVTAKERNALYDSYYFQARMKYSPSLTLKLSAEAIVTLHNTPRSQCRRSYTPRPPADCTTSGPLLLETHVSNNGHLLAHGYVHRYCAYESTWKLMIIK